jgi:hypothetical protein
LTPDTIEAVPGATVSALLTLHGSAASATDIELENLPEGVFFLPLNPRVGSLYRLRFAVTDSVAPGLHRITVRATSTGRSRTAMLTLAVVPSLLTLAPAVVLARNGQASTIVRLTRPDGVPVPITLSLDDPSGATTGTFSENPTLDSAVTLGLQVAPPGGFVRLNEVLVKGRVGNIVQTASLTILVVGFRGWAWNDHASVGASQPANAGTRLPKYTATATRAPSTESSV